MTAVLHSSDEQKMGMKITVALCQQQKTDDNDDDDDRLLEGNTVCVLIQNNH